MDDGIGDGGDVVPAKWWASEAEVGWGAIWGCNGEGEVGGVGGGENEGPVEVLDVSVVEV